jgi:hypothetical protein
MNMNACLRWCEKTSIERLVQILAAAPLPTHTILLNDDGSNYDGRTNGYTHTSDGTTTNETNDETDDACVEKDLSRHVLMQ